MTNPPIIMANPSDEVPSTKRKLRTFMESVSRMREQGVDVSKQASPSCREEGYLLRGATTSEPMKDFRELQRVFVPKETDVFVASFPKSGTTWIQHIVSLIKNNGVDDGRDLDDKWLWCEIFSAAEVEQYSASCEGARLFKSHLPYTLMPGLSADSPAKYIYAYRNPKDTAVSYYYHTTALRGQISWVDFFEMFINGQPPLGSIFDHHTEWWQHKGDSNILFMSYEEMKADLEKSIRTIADFLHHDLTDSELSKITKQCEFASMKQNDAVNKTALKVFDKQFIRKGIVGDWKNHFTAEQSARMDKLVAEKITPIGLEYDYGQ